ncbi:ribokinase [Petrotoga mexicana DSM 14811]|uniref:Ribokinase n=1 Tax=Petrotoga mexicana DSM 14811 TaxID=1122954 RepID=A0A2K1P660_9BACT|nr:ribokinase [Petrotoga mexicana DSM 14811]
MKKERIVISVCVLNLNPCYDHWVIIEKESPIPNVLRGDKVVKLVDGKGLNIGRVFNTLGFKDYLCLNIVGGEVGKIIESGSRKEGIKSKFFWIEEENRINTAVVFEYEKRMIMINEPGPHITNLEINKFISFFQQNLKEDDKLIISGSAPQRFESYHLMELINFAKKKNCEIDVDIGGTWLKEIVESSPPDILKINSDELKVAFDIDIKETSKVNEFRKKNHIKELIITHGKEGSWGFFDEILIKATPKKIFSDYSVGSGDSFFAGYLYGKEKKFPLEECLKIATACGIANTLHYGAAIFNKQDFKDQLKNVEIKKVVL